MTPAPLVVERTYQAPLAAVWRALTDPAQLREWYFRLDDFRAEPGFRFSFTGQGTKGEHYVHHCVVTEVVPERRLAYTWCYEGVAGSSTVTFELTPEGTQTRLRLTHSGLESFAQHGPDFQPSSFESGWTEIIGTMLRRFVEEGASGPEHA